MLTMPIRTNQQSEGESGPGSSSTILLVEDDQPTRELYQRELSREFQVLACASESEALKLLHRHSVSAIILEPALQNQQGWSFLATLHDLTQTRSTPIIVCSTQDERRRGLKLGATLYLIKPVLPNVLLEVLHRAINSPIRT